LIWLVTGHTNTSSAPDSNQAAQDQPQPTSDSAANNTVTPSTPSMPDDEAKFVAAVSAAQSTYDAAPNDMAKGRTRADRRSAICQALQGGLSANGWVGTIKTLSSNTDGKGVLEISLAPSLSVETMNNDLSDIGHNTLLASDSPILSAASAMKEGDAVVFSGTFFPSDVDCVEETSLTLEGSMQEPAFILRFTSVSSPASSAATDQSTVTPQASAATQQGQGATSAPPAVAAPTISAPDNSATEESGAASPANGATTPNDVTTSSAQNGQPPGATPAPHSWNEASSPYRSTPDDLEGAAAFDRGDFVASFETLSPLTDRGDPVAQFFVGVMYLAGHGVQKNPPLAVQLLYRSATAGVADAQNYMGAFYRTGHNVPLNYATAMQWYLFAAKQNYKNAQYRIALMYRDGLGVDRDNRQAYVWACISAAGGPPEAIALRARLQKQLSAEDAAQAEQEAVAWQAHSITPTPVSIYGLTGAEPVSPNNGTASSNDGSMPAASPEAAQLDIVKRFYGALSQGNGLAASMFVVPDKRANGPFSASQLTYYYSSLQRGLRLDDEKFLPGVGVAVRYSYTRGNGIGCVGSAVVKIDNGGGLQSPQIAGINLVSGNC